MKKPFAALLFFFLASAAHASVVFTSTEARALTLPASVEIATATLDLSQSSPALTLTGQDFISNRYPARLVSQSNGRIDAVMNIVLPRSDGRNCTEFQSATLRIIAPNLELEEGALSIILNPENLLVIGVHESAPDSCRGPHQIRTVNYVMNRY